MVRPYRDTTAPNNNRKLSWLTAFPGSFAEPMHGIRLRVIWARKKHLSTVTRALACSEQLGAFPLNFHFLLNHPALVGQGGHRALRSRLVTPEPPRSLGSQMPSASPVTSPQASHVKECKLRPSLSCLRQGLHPISASQARMILSVNKPKRSSCIPSLTS